MAGLSPASLSIHHPIHVLTASLKDVASIPVISLAADTQHQEISGEPQRPAGLVRNILPSAVEGPRREIERCDKDKIKLCFVLIARSVVKGGQSSCGGGESKWRSAQRGSARMDGEWRVSPPDKWFVGMLEEEKLFSRAGAPNKIVPDW